MKQKTLLFLLWISICLSSIILEGQETAAYTDSELLYKKGLELYEKQVFQAAKSKFDQAYLQFDSDPKTYNLTLKTKAKLYAISCALNTDFPGAQIEAERFIVINRNDPLFHEAVIQLGNYYYNAEKYRKAIHFYDFFEYSYASASKHSEVAFKKGYSYFVQKDFNSASAAFIPAVDFKNQYYYPINYYLGLCYYFEGEYEESLVKLERVTNSKKYKHFVPHLLAQIYFGLENYDKVIAIGNEALTRPDTRNTLELENLIGKAYFEKGNYAFALTHLSKYAEKAEKLSREDHYQLGLLYYKDMNHQLAISHFKPVIKEKDQLSQNAAFYLGDCYANAGDLEAARDAFVTAMRLHIDASITSEARFLYGILSADLGYDREAINTLMSIMPETSFYLKAQERLGLLFVQTEDYIAAIDILESFNLNSPQLKLAFQKVTLYKALQFVQENNCGSAIQYFDKSLSSPVDKEFQLQALFWKGECTAMDNNYAVSIDCYHKYFTLYDHTIDLPANASPAMAHYNQGYNYWMKGDLNSAIRHFDNCSNLISSYGFSSTTSANYTAVYHDALLRSGDCYFKKNMYEEAISKYETAIGVDEASRDYAIFQSALIQGLRGNQIEKILSLEKVLEIHPPSALKDEALFELGNTYIEIDKSAESVEYFSQLVDEFGHSSKLCVKSLLKLGLVSYNQGDLNQAATFYKSVFNYNPNSSEVHDALTALEEIYVKDLGNPEEYFAFTASSTGMDIDELTKDSLSFKAANIKYLDGDYKGASASFDVYITKFPDGLYIAEALYKKAESRSILNDYIGARKAYNKVVELGPGVFQSQALGKAALIAYNEQEEFTAAFELYAQLLEISIDDDSRRESLMGMIRSGFRSDQYEKVILASEKLFAIEHISEEQKFATYYYRGKAALALGNKKLALGSLNKLTTGPKTAYAAEARFLIAGIYFSQQEIKVAEEMARQAIQENSTYPYWVAQSMLLFCDISIEMENLIQARAAAEAIIENYPGDELIVELARQKLLTITDLEQSPELESELLEMDREKDGE